MNSCAITITFAVDFPMDCDRIVCDIVSVVYLLNTYDRLHTVVERA